MLHIATLYRNYRQAETRRLAAIRTARTVQRIERQNPGPRFARLR